MTDCKTCSSHFYNVPLQVFFASSSLTRFSVGVLTGVKILVIHPHRLIAFRTHARLWRNGAFTRQGQLKGSNTSVNNCTIYYNIWNTKFLTSFAFPCLGQFCVNVADGCARNIRVVGDGWVFQF